MKPRFVPIKLSHGEHMPWERVTHVRLLGRAADTRKAQESLAHIRAFADEHGVAALADIEPDFPGRLLAQKGRLGAMRFDLRHFANDRHSGGNEQDKGLIELGYMEELEDIGMVNGSPNMKLALNQILYGPPGTGKTYATIDAALEILDPVFLEGNQGKRTVLKKRFDELVAAGQVCFVTFHQSFSYEDFVQGIRAETVAGHLQYSVHDGIFKQLCDRARLGVAVGNDVFEQALVRFRQAIAEADESGLLLKTITGKTFRVEHSGGSSVLAFPASAVDQKHDYFVLLKDVRRLYEGADKKSITNNSSYVWGVLDFLYKQCGLPPCQAVGVSKEGAEKFVLIIDEINRGNVSRIFGELITLIEPSKREGAEEELAVSLPYGSEGESFSVPDNVYLIGTMNTADRSLAGLDIALRRRFTFKEMPPRPDLLDEVLVEGVSIGQLLRVMNQRIEVLLGRDYCLGHAYFMEMESYESERTLAHLGFIFRQKILPLLQEYFFEDWERIGWVLNDQHAASKGTQPFIRQPASEQGLVALFGNTVAEGLSDRRWELNDSAFDSIDSYRNILGNAG